MNSIMYHYTIFNAENNDIVFEIDINGHDKNYCSKMLDYELMRRHMFDDKMNSKIKIKGTRMEIKQRTIKTIMSQYGYNIKGLSERFGIPYRTVQNWASEQRECPSYIMNMMEEILNKEN